MKRIVILTLLAGLCTGLAWSQPYSDRSNRRTAILNGNQVRSVFGNWGVIGQPAEQGRRGAWRDDNNGYLGDVSPLVGAEVKWRDTTFHAVVLSPVARPQTNPRSEDPVSGKPWAFEPVPGYFAGPPNQSIAISSNPLSWPAQWPNRPSSYDGKWDGYFGPRVSADLETYFLMDDHNFERFSDSLNNARRIQFRPDAARPNRKGLGLELKVRGLQWAQFLAQDNIFWLYEITNTGTTTYDRMVFGMLVGTYVGVTSTENAGEYNDDWSFYDVHENITYTGDYGRDTRANPRWNQKYRVGMVGYAFLESPGNPFDGIDNDGDADSTLLGQSAPQFTPARFDSTLITAGQRVILIGNDFTRTAFTVPVTDTVTVVTRGRAILLRPGVTKLAEGNEVFFAGSYFVNPNAYDGVDNDLDGVIDENYYLHYRQLKRQPDPTRPPLIDILRPVRYVNYATGAGTNPQSMLDEKRNDLVDNDHDWSRDVQTGEPLFDPDGNLLDDVGRDGVGRTNDFGERDGLPTSGYTAGGTDTGLPGEPNMDKTDVDESDQIGLSSFNYFTPAGEISFGDDERLWRQIAPGFFSVPTSIIQNRPIAGEDGDFIYSSGYFPLLPGATERFSLALVYGGGKAGASIDGDIADLLKNKRTVQKIYDANYQFPMAPEKPRLTAVAGDRQVTLYWDRGAELSVDPVLKVNDFEGYKLYKATDPDFNEVFTITDGSGSPRGYRPLVQYDLVDSLKGYFQATGELFDAAQGYNFFLGDDTGLEHSFVDYDVENGRKYYYAIVAYDRGDDGIKIFPAENTKITQLIPGQDSPDINCAVVRPNAPVAGYVDPLSSVPLSRLSAYGTGSVAYNVLDKTQTTGNVYTVTFMDTRYDSLDNNGNGILDDADSTEWDRRTSSYSVKDARTYVDRFISRDTLPATLPRKHQDVTTVQVTDAQGAVVPPSAYTLDTQLGAIRSSSPGSLPEGVYQISYQYYPVYRSPYIKGSPFAGETRDADIFDGVELDFTNAWAVSLSNPDSVWRRPDGTSPYLISYSPVETEIAPGVLLRGFRHPVDYEIQFANSIVDTSAADPFLFVPAVPVNFRVFNLTDSVYVDFIFAENTPGPTSTGKISPNDEILFFDTRQNGSRVYSWDLRFSARPTDPPDTVYALGAGDRMQLRVTKPFRQGDVMQFQTARATAVVPDGARSEQLDRIRVVPNPYVAAAAFEAPLAPEVTGGRGERKILFTRLPAGATVKVFTARGEHVITLEHDGNIEDGTVAWNLKSKENLDIAFGVYFYVVESSIGTKTGKIAIIK